MPTKTVVENWVKATTLRTKVEAERQERLNSGAISSIITDDATNWILTSEYQVIQPKSKK